MQVIGHRGAKGEAPENTIGGFRYALEKGVTHFELDVRLSADGQPVIFHDPTTRRTTGRNHRVTSCSTAQLARMDAAHFHAQSWPLFERVPTLFDVLPLLEKSESIQLEIKSEQAHTQHTLLQAISGLLQDCDPTRYTITSADKNILTLAQRLLPDNRRGLVCKRPLINYIMMGNRLNCQLLIFQHRLLSRRIIDQAQQAGFEVSTYTTNDIKRIRKLRGWGIDSIITDYPVKYLHLQQPVAWPSRHRTIPEPSLVETLFPGYHT